MNDVNDRSYYKQVHGGYALALRRNRGYLNQSALVDLCEAPVSRYLVSRWELLLAANLIMDSWTTYLDGRQVQGRTGSSGRDSES